MIRVSPPYSCQERSAWISGRNGHKSGPPFSEVRSAFGPKKPSDCPVARTASIQRRVAASAVASPVTIARSVYPRSQYGTSSQPPLSGRTQPVAVKSRKCENSSYRPHRPSSWSFSCPASQPRAFTLPGGSLRNAVGCSGAALGE